MSSKLEQLKSMTTVVADTGDIMAIRKYRPTDATTNPSLLLKAAAIAEYEPLLSQAVAQSQGKGQARVADACERLAVSIGTEILGIVPGYVSTEVDARLSFDSAATIEKARKIISLYAANGIPRERVLIKIAATWEGIQAARLLEQEGIQCNLTLLFGFAQAVACAEAGVTLISPFVGRILDWYKHNGPQQEYLPDEDPGVLSVTRIYRYYKHYDYNTIIMGASFRNIGEIEALAGCDRLTISPQLMEELDQNAGTLERRLTATDIECADEKINLDEHSFRWLLNEDAMATEKLAEGIRNFARDQITLEELVAKRILAEG